MYPKNAIFLTKKKTCIQMVKYLLNTISYGLEIRSSLRSYVVRRCLDRAMGKKTLNIPKIT